MLSMVRTTKGKPILETEKTSWGKVVSDTEWILHNKIVGLMNLVVLVFHSLPQ